jgi:hypothetical protein
MSPKTRNRILGASVIVAILVWQVWLGYEVVTPPEIPMPDPQTIVVEPAPVQVQVTEPEGLDPTMDFIASDTTHLTNLDVAGNITMQTTTYTRTAPLTITHYLTNVRLIYYQLP